MSPARRTGALVVAALLGSVVLAGCSDDVGTSGGDQGYVSGTGTITSLAVEDREAPGPVEGETLDGEAISLDDYAGQVVVINVWGSWCTPCRTEAPILADAAKDQALDDVVFLGINTRDPERSRPQGFVRTYDIGYPSIYDPTGRTLLAFSGTLPANAIPSTVVIDEEGRVAARVLGEITRTTLYGLVEDVSTTGAAGGAR